MWTSVICSLMLAQGAPVAPTPVAPKLEFKDGFFVVTDASGSQRVNTKVWAKPVPKSFELKDQNRILSWTWKGLTVQVGKQVRTTRLVDLPVSAKFFSPERLAQNQALIKSGEGIKEVAGLAGWERQGDSLYFLPRWMTKSKKPWLEMLIRVDLSKPSPWFETLAAWEGISVAKAPIEDQLFATPTGLASVSELGSDWGITNWPLKSPKSTFTEVGKGPRWFDIAADGSTVRFVEKTSYGTSIAGVASVPAGVRTVFAESRDPIAFPGDSMEIVQITSGTSVTLRNTDSGLELKLPKDVAVRTIASGVLVWIPKEKPSQAVLYSTTGLRAIARWSAPRTAPAARSGAGKPTPPKPRG